MSGIHSDDVRPPVRGAKKSVTMFPIISTHVKRTDPIIADLTNVGLLISHGKKEKQID